MACRVATGGSPGTIMGRGVTAKPFAGTAGLKLEVGGCTCVGVGGYTCVGWCMHASFMACSAPDASFQL